MASLPSKKPRKEKSSTKSPKKRDEKGNNKPQTLDEVRKLGNDLLSSRAHLNNLPDLLSFISPSPHSLEFAVEAMISLQSFFVPLLSEMKSTGDDQDPETVFKSWLKERFNEFMRSLVQEAVSSETDETLKEIVLEAFMDIIKLGKNGSFQYDFYRNLIKSIASCSLQIHSASPIDDLLNLLQSKIFKYADVRYFTYTSMEKIVKSIDTKETETKMPTSDSEEQLKFRNEIAIRNAYSVLSSLPPLDLGPEPNFEMWSENGISSKETKMSTKPSTSVITKKLKLKFTKAWLSFLKVPLPLDLYKEVLATLYQNVIPFMSNPAILCDFLTRSYDIGGVISVMALSGLFILMTQHGLEYPKFYEKLYALLTPSVFLAKHRAVFFQLLDSCLKSSYLPAYLAASFAKKLSRLALSVPPSGALIIIALTHNLLRRHPSINFLEAEEEKKDADSGEVNESIDDAKETDCKPRKHKKRPGIDPFNNDETDPVKSNAMRSSLWEIDSLRHHYSPAVSRFVASLENDLTIRRRIKQVPLAFYRTTPISLFSESDFPGWAFQSQPDENKIENGIEMINNAEEIDQTNVKRPRLES
ncbi:nucleolar complex protein 4 B isoform X2 [Carex littledalei]|uniref:Nucleolar complex protein 4 B isoform X2 n=1 Tax=Carex littledalei TaxID=544730 RepID=A0A833VJG0_9POAL|nr:nucleolar complex protein 4 B isoform X2 [Carex littledalei]